MGACKTQARRETRMQVGTPGVGGQRYTSTHRSGRSRCRRSRQRVTCLDLADPSFNPQSRRCRNCCWHLARQVHSASKPASLHGNPGSMLDDHDRVRLHSAGMCCSAGRLRIAHTKLTCSSSRPVLHLPTGSGVGLPCSSTAYPSWILRLRKFESCCRVVAGTLLSPPEHWRLVRCCSVPTAVKADLNDASPSSSSRHESKFRCRSSDSVASQRPSK